MATLVYKLTETKFRRSVQPMMKKAVTSTANYINECRANQKKNILPLEKLHKKYVFDENKAGETIYYAVHSRSEQSGKLVLYFHGGNYLTEGDRDDFEFAQDMADKTGADVWLVWYPLFPDTTPEKMMESVLNVYQEALRTRSANDIIFFGLASGASLCLATAIHASRKKMKVPQVGKMILFSPIVRIPLTMEQYADIQKMGDCDCMFPPEYMRDMGKVLDTAGIDFSEVPWFRSPIQYSWKGLREMLVIYGEKEFLSVQLEEIKQRCIHDNVKLSTIVGKEMMHTWMISGFLPEARDGRKMVYDYIKGNEIA